jgi:hypothetical protein
MRLARFVIPANVKETVSPYLQGEAGVPDFFLYAEGGQISSTKDRMRSSGV